MIPVNTPLISGNEQKYLIECIQTGWISSEGPFVQEFEQKMAKFVNRNFGVAVSNGSAALDIAIRSLSLPAGSEVIMPTFTIISPAASLVSSGLTPVLVDSDPITWNMNVDEIESKITEKTSAILVVHIYGLPVEMNKVLEIAKKYNLKVIEDAAEMHGQTYLNQQCGSFGDISIFSFYPNKHITTGEGGMILTNDEELANKCHYYKNLCFEPHGRRFVHHELGWNYRITNLQAALGVAQLENIEKHIHRKREIGELYNSHLQDINNKVQLPLKTTVYADNIYWVYGLITDSEIECEKLTNYLSSQKIGTRPFFWCMHEQPVFIKKGMFKNEKFPVAEKLARNGLYIPSGLGLSNSQIETVAGRIKHYYEENI